MSYLFFFSMASGIVLSDAFGMDVQASGQPDPFIAAAREAVAAISASGIFGAYMVDWLPSRKST